MALKEGPGGNLQYRDTYYPGTARLDEAQPVEVSPYVETNGLRFSVPTEKAYIVTGSLVSRGKRTVPRPTDIVVLKRNEAEQMSGYGGAALFPDGTFKISGLPPGEYTLSAIATTNAGEISEGYASVRMVDSDVHVNLQVGQAAEVRGRVEGPAEITLAGQQIILQANGGSYHPSAIDRGGHFDIVNLPPGDYTVSMTEPNAVAEPTYIKRALCSGKGYTSEPLVLGVSTVLDCELVVANDTGVVGGQVTGDDKPAAGLLALLIPEASELRRLPRYTQTGKTHVSGRYRIRGVIPGDYLLFAVPMSEDHIFFAPDFAHRNQANAEHVRVDPRTIRVVNLRASRKH